MAGIGTIIALMFALLYLALSHGSQLRGIQGKLQIIHEKTELAFTMREAIRKRSFSLSSIVMMDDFFERDAEQQRFNEYAREFLLARDKLLSLGIGPEEQLILNDFQGMVQSGQPIVENAINELAEGPPRQEARDLALRAIGIQTGQFVIFDRLFKVLKELEFKQIETARTDGDRAQQLLILLGSLALLTGAFIAVIIVRRERGYMDAMLLEISERKKAEDHVRELNASLEARVDERTAQLNKSRDALLEAQRVATIGSWEWLIPENRVAWSRETFNILGISPKLVEPNFDAFNALIHKEDVDRVKDAVDDAVINGSSYNIQFRIIRTDGNLLFVNSIGNTEFDGDGQLVRLFGTLQDITVQKEAELSIHKALEEADIANRSKSELLANMSHELRTPLNAIIGFSSSIREEIYGPLGHEKYREYLEDISKSGEHLLELINDILDVSAVEAGKMEFHEEPLDFAKLAAASVRLIKERSEDAHIRLLTDVDPHLPYIFADERRIKQILLNLLSNAVKFTQSGGKVTLGASVDNDNRYVITVTDTGIGMTREGIFKALSQFGQVNRGSFGKHEGTGLGLPLTKALVELHGGTLEIDSEKDVGTTVTAHLPAERTFENVEYSST